MNAVEEILAAVRAGLSPEALARVAEQEAKAEEQKRQRADCGRNAHTQPSNPLKELRIAVRAFRRAAESLRLIHGGARLRDAAQALADVAEDWRKRRSKKRRAEAPIVPKQAKRPRLPRTDPAQMLLWAP